MNQRCTSPLLRRDAKTSPMTRGGDPGGLDRELPGGGEGGDMRRLARCLSCSATSQRIPKSDPKLYYSQTQVGPSRHPRTHSQHELPTRSLSKPLLSRSLHSDGTPTLRRADASITPPPRPPRVYDRRNLPTYLLRCRLVGQRSRCSSLLRDAGSRKRQTRKPQQPGGSLRAGLVFTAELCSRRTG